MHSNKQYLATTIMPAASLLEDLLSLFFPRTCYGCNSGLMRDERILCLSCMIHLPLARISGIKENRLSELFWGRVPIEAATALLLFYKGGMAQKLIHNLKYSEKKEIGMYLGSMLGREILESPHFAGIDVIVPVPLHAKRQRKRGFNQSQLIGEGLTSATGIPLCTDVLIRITPTQTQTRKSRFLRWKNVESVFHIANPSVFENRNILLLDDVVTTGSTLEACAAKLLECKGARVWIAAAALAS